jgi:hypothetical protein
MSNIPGWREYEAILLHQIAYLNVSNEYLLYVFNGTVRRQPAPLFFLICG